ncbi:hypothetical protein FRC17_001143, partial [Serendipita sp. 399]
LAIETVILGATLFHSFQFRQTIGNIRGARSVGILTRLSSHGVQYFLIMLLFRLSTILCLYLAPLGIQSFFPTLNFYLTSVLTARFVLSLQREIVDSQTAPPTIVAGGTQITTGHSLTQMPKRSPLSRLSATRFITSRGDDNGTRSRTEKKTTVFVAMEQFVSSDRRESIQSVNPRYSASALP